MNIYEVAAELTGKEYPLRIPDHLCIAAKNAGIVFVYGASDDLMEFDGAISEEIGARGDDVAFVHSGALLPDFDTLCDERDEDGLEAYFQAKPKCQPIKAVWDRDGISWQYETDIPHATFDVMEDGEVYCRGIVFRLEDVKHA